MELTKTDLLQLLNSEDFGKLSIELEKQNIFSILNIGHVELRHSSFLCWLLNPRECHGLGDKFLRQVLRAIFDVTDSGRDIIDADLIGLDSIEIRREWEHIDILILLEDDVIAIENKIHSQDHSNQLSRYQETVNAAFTTINKHFIYLTPYGNEPGEDSTDYCLLSYLEISNILSRLLSIYGKTLSAINLSYINDYCTILKRDLMNNDSANEMALKLYRAHQKVIDFIIENKPDPASILYPYFEDAVKKKGYQVLAKNKGYIRYVPREVNDLLPKGIASGWKEGEIFAFSIDFYWTEGKAIFDVVMAPSDHPLKDILMEALSNNVNSKTPAGKKWKVYYKDKVPFSANEIITDDAEDIEDTVSGLISRFEPIVQSMTKSILDYKPQISAKLEQLHTAHN